MIKKKWMKHKTHTIKQQQSPKSKVTTKTTILVV